MGFLQYNSGHCTIPTEATALADEFFKRAFDGDTNANTDVMSINASGIQQPMSDWAPCGSTGTGARCCSKPWRARATFNIPR
jgi:hypothetical protein